MSLFEICVLAGIVLHLVVLVWVLLWIKAQLDLIGHLLHDMRHITEYTYDIKKNVRDAWEKQQTEAMQKFVDKKRAMEEDKERARQELKELGKN